VIAGDATVVIDCEPDDVFEFVLDLDRYRGADHKIGRVVYVRRDGNRGTSRFWGRLRWGLPGPPGTYAFELDPGKRLTFTSAGGLLGLLLDFHGLFECQPNPDGPGILVRHREQFDFRGPVRFLLDPLLRRWLEADTVEEMQRVKQMLEASSD
jgi:hypothetical protein